MSRRKERTAGQPLLLTGLPTDGFRAIVANLRAH